MRSLSFKIQIALFVIILIAGLVYSYYWNISKIEKKSIMAEVMQKVVLQARNIALTSTKPLLHEDPEFELHPLINRIMRNQRDIVSIVITDRNGRIKGHHDLVYIDKKISKSERLNKVDSGISLLDGEELLENDNVIEVRAPITEQGERIGTVYLQYSKASINKAISRAASRLVRLSAIALIIGAFISILLAHHITRPIAKLTMGARRIGQGDLDTRINVRSVKEIQLLADTFNEMVERLKDGQNALLEREKMHKELEIARNIQATLLPSRLPHLRNFELDAYYHPASEVGGDYFDLIRVDQKRIMIVVGDVAGKGVPGLVIMAMVRILVRSLAQRASDPASLLRHLNVLLLKDIKKNLFVTLFIGLLDTENNVLEFASAAHMPLVVFHCREKMVRMIGTDAKPLGIFSDEVFVKGLENKKIKLMPGDLFLQFTDGLSEMRNESGEEYSLERILQITADEAAGGARHLVAKLKEDLVKFRGQTAQSDDLTIVAISALPEGIVRVPECMMENPDKVVFE